MCKLNQLVPKGNYCYSYTGRISIENKVIDENGRKVSSKFYFMPETKLCPFWKSFAEKNAYCIYLQQKSEAGGFTHLLWDQVKKCSINNDDDLTIF